MSDVLAALEVPGPTPVAVTEPFWDGVERGELRIQRCRSCQAGVFYPRELCPRCWSTELVWEQAEGTGVLLTFSLVVRPGHPGWQAAAPYLVGIVELDEGPRMLAHLLAPSDPAPGPVAVGARVGFVATDIGGRILPAFRVIEPKEGET